jgi:hypothetical protein
MTSTKELEKKMVSEVTDTLKDTLKEVKNSVKEATKGTKYDSLEQMQKFYETVTVKIYKKNPQKHNFGLFLKLDGQDPNALAEVGLDALAQDQGGKGEYRVEVWPPKGGTPYVQGPFETWGDISYSEPKIIREQNAKNQSTGVLPLQPSRWTTRPTSKTWWDTCESRMPCPVSRKCKTTTSKI